MEKPVTLFESIKKHIISSDSNRQLFMIEYNLDGERQFNK